MHSFPSLRWFAPQAFRIPRCLETNQVVPDKFTEDIISRPHTYMPHLHVLRFEEIIVGGVLTRLVSEAVRLDGIVRARVGADSRVGTAGAGLVRGAIDRSLSFVLAEVLIDTGIILLFADALLGARHLVALAALDGGTQARSFAASSRLAELPAVLWGLLDVASAILRTPVAKLAASGPGAPVAPHAVHRAFLSEARAHLRHVALARETAGETCSKLRGAALVVIVSVEHRRLTRVLGAVRVVRRWLRGHLYSALAILDAVLATRSIALAPRTPRAENTVNRARPVPCGEAVAIDCGREWSDRGHARADIAEHLVVVRARYALRLEQRVGNAVVGRLGAVSI